MRATLYNRVGVVKRHVERRRFSAFPFIESFCFFRAFVFAHATRLAFRILRWNLVPPTIYPALENQIMIRCPNFPTLREGKAPNQSNDELLRHQGGPRAALHANQLRVIGLAAQHPIHPHGQLASDGDLSYTGASPQL